MEEPNVELAEQVASDQKDMNEGDELPKDPEIAPEHQTPAPISTKDIKKAMRVKKKKEQDEKKKKYFTKEDRLSRLERYEELDRNHKIKQEISRIFYNDGRPTRLIHGTDFRAELCGLNRLKGLDYLYFFQPTIDINVRQCVAICPNSSGTQICLYNNTNPITDTPYCYTQLQSTASGRNCLPVEPVNRDTVNTYLATMNYQIMRTAGDISLTLDLLAVGLILSIILSVLCFRWMKNDRWVKYVIWSGIWATLFACIAAAVFCYLEYRRTIVERCLASIDKYGCGGTKATAFWWLIWGFSGLGLVYICIIMKVFNKINLAIGIIKATSKLITVLAQSGKVPWILMTIEICVGIWTIASAMLALSIGEIVTIPANNINGNQVRTLQITSWVRLLVFFDFFMLFWWLNIVLMVGDFLISYSLATWFFTRRKATVNIPTWRFMKMILKSHLGTIIFLSLTKIFFQVPRTILSLTRTLLRGGKQFSNFTRFFQVSCLFCLHAYERFLRYVSKNTLVQCVIWSEPYSVSSKRAFFLLYRNERKIRGMDFLQAFVVFQTKIMCGLVGCLITYLVIALAPRSIAQVDLSQVESPIGSTIIVFIFGFLYSSIFQGQFDIANKTLIQCYLMDEEMFIGEQRFVEDDIKKFMEFFRLQMDEDDDVKIQDGAKALNQKIRAGDKFMAIEDDPDIEINKKLEIKEETSSEESSSEESSEEDSDEEEEKKAGRRGGRRRGRRRGQRGSKQ